MNGYFRLEEEMRLCVIVPMYNEEAIAERSIRTILEYAAKLPTAVTVLAVDDGSKDTTAHILKGLAAQREGGEFRWISHPENRGYGAALKTGVKFAVDNNYDYVIFMDSDLTDHPKYLSAFYEKINEGWDYIKATRYSKGGGTEGVPLGHRAVSIAGNLLARVLYRLPLTDFTNGFRAVKVDLLRQIHLVESGFAIIMEEIYMVKRLTKSFCEVPYVLTSRKKEQGVTRFSYGPQTCAQYLKYALKSFIQHS